MHSRCPNCNFIKATITEPRAIERCRSRLKPVPGQGRYYRGEEYQLSLFRLWQCPECSDHFEDAHHFYSDPQSTMGLARDEEEWFNFSRLTPEELAERLDQLG